MLFGKNILYNFIQVDWTELSKSSLMLEEPWIIRSNFNRLYFFFSIWHSCQWRWCCRPL